MEKEVHIAWAEELLSRQERGFDYPAHLPTLNHVKIWLRKTRDNWPWKQIALEVYPDIPVSGVINSLSGKKEQSLSARISEVRRAFKAVNRFLASPLLAMIEKEKHKPSDKERISSYLMACDPQLLQRTKNEIRREQTHPWKKATHRASCEECRKTYEWAERNAPWEMVNVQSAEAILEVPGSGSKNHKPANLAQRIIVLKTPRAKVPSNVSLRSLGSKPS